MLSLRVKREPYLGLIDVINTINSLQSQLSILTFPLKSGLRRLLQKIRIHHPTNFILRFSNCACDKHLVNISPYGFIFSILGNLIPCLIICSQNQCLFEQQWLLAVNLGWVVLQEPKLQHCPHFFMSISGSLSGSNLTSFSILWVTSIRRKS